MLSITPMQRFDYVVAALWFLILILVLVYAVRWLRRHRDD